MQSGGKFDWQLVGVIGAEDKAEKEARLGNTGLGSELDFHALFCSEIPPCYEFVKVLSLW